MLASCRKTIVARDTRIRRLITEVQSMQAAHDSELQQVQMECLSQLEFQRDDQRLKEQLEVAHRKTEELESEIEQKKRQKASRNV